VGQGGQRRPFAFQVSRYRMAEVVVRLDWQHHGLGSGSCGPRTLDAYALQCEGFAPEVLLQGAG